MARSMGNLSSKNISVSLSAIYCSIFQLASTIQRLYIISNKMSPRVLEAMHFCTLPISFLGATKVSYYQ